MTQTQIQHKQQWPMFQTFFSPYFFHCITEIQMFCHPVKKQQWPEETRTGLNRELLPGIRKTMTRLRRLCNSRRGLDYDSHH